MNIEQKLRKDLRARINRIAGQLIKSSQMIDDNEELYDILILVMAAKGGIDKLLREPFHEAAATHINLFKHTPPPHFSNNREALEKLTLIVIEQGVEDAKKLARLLMELKLLKNNSL